MTPSDSQDCMPCHPGMKWGVSIGKSDKKIWVTGSAFPIGSAGGQSGKFKVPFAGKYPLIVKLTNNPGSSVRIGNPGGTPITEYEVIVGSVDCCGVTVTVVEADFVVSAWLVAVTFAVVCAVTVGAVKSPVDEMVFATLDDHVTAVFEVPVTVAVNCRVAPETTDGFCGAIETDIFTAAVTVSVVDPLTEPDAAEIVVVPAATACAAPAAATVATAWFDELQIVPELDVMSFVELSEYVPIAVYCSALPATTDAFTGVTAMEISFTGGC